MKGFSNNKKKIILTFSLFLFAVSLIYRVTNPYRQPKVDRLTYSGSVSKGTVSQVDQNDAVISSREESMIKLDLFLNPPAHSREQSKNIFLGQVAMEEIEPLLESDIDQTAVNGALTAADENKLEDELSSFRSFGYMERVGERVLFIEKGNQIMLIRKGDRIEGKYVVKDITKNELTLTVIPDNEVVYIDLSGL